MLFVLIYQLVIWSLRSNSNTCRDIDVQKLLGGLGVRKPFVFNLPTTLHVENLSSKAIHMASSEATRRCSLILSRRQHCITFSVTDVL